MIEKPSKSSFKKEHFSLNLKNNLFFLYGLCVLTVQDERSPDKAGHQSDDERWDTPPPKPPRIRR